MALEKMRIWEFFCLSLCFNYASKHFLCSRHNKMTKQIWRLFCVRRRSLLHFRSMSVCLYTRAQLDCTAKKTLIHTVCACDLHDGRVVPNNALILSAIAKTMHLRNYLEFHRFYSAGAIFFLITKQVANACGMGNLMVSLIVYHFLIWAIASARAWAHTHTV